MQSRNIDFHLYLDQVRQISDSKIQIQSSESQKIQTNFTLPYARDALKLESTGQYN